ISGVGTVAARPSREVALTIERFLAFRVGGANRDSADQRTAHDSDFVKPGATVGFGVEYLFERVLCLVGAIELQDSDLHGSLLFVRYRSNKSSPLHPSTVMPALRKH